MQIYDNSIRARIRDNVPDQFETCKPGRVIDPINMIVLS